MSGNAFKLIKENLPLKYREFLSGVAQGSGIPFDDLLVGSFYETINTGCSSVLVRFTGDNGYDLVHAKNRDSKNAVTHQAVVEFYPTRDFDI